MTSGLQEELMALTKDGGLRFLPATVLMQSRGRDRNLRPLTLGPHFPDLNVPATPAGTLLKCTFTCGRLAWDSVFRRGSQVMPGFFLVQGPHLE